MNSYSPIFDGKSIDQSPANKEIEIKTNPEYAKLFPKMSKKDFDSLVISIKENGQHDLISLNSKHEILDGHNRFRACQILKIIPKYHIKTFDNPLLEKLYVYEVNLLRRHLSDFQRVEIALGEKPILQELAKLNMSKGGKGVRIPAPLGRLNKIIGDQCNRSSTYVDGVEKILNEAPEEIKEKARSNTMSVNKAIGRIEKKKHNDKLSHEALNNPMIKKLPKVGAQLIYGDFLKRAVNIADNSIALIHTDPLYYEDTLVLYDNLAPIAYRVLQKGGSLVMYVPNGHINKIIRYMEDAGLTYWWTLIVDLEGSFDKHYPRHVSIKQKPLLWFVKGSGLNTTDFISDLIRSEKPDKAESEYEQSVKESEHVIARLTVENQIVFDPMMGTGTAGEAALNLKRKFIGIEIDKDIFKKAQLRISKFAKSIKSSR